MSTTYATQLTSLSQYLKKKRDFKCQICKRSPTKIPLPGKQNIMHPSYDDTFVVDTAHTCCGYTWLYMPAGAFDQHVEAVNFALSADGQPILNTDNFLTFLFKRTKIHLLQYK